MTDVSEVSFYRNAFVTVLNENATYHVDEAGNVIAVSRNPLFSDTYTPQHGDYKNVIVYNFTQNEAYIFNPLGQYKIIALFDGASAGSSDGSS